MNEKHPENTRKTPGKHRKTLFSLALFSFLTAATGVVHADSWAPTGSMLVPQGHGMKAVLLPNGKVLATGGLDLTNGPYSAVAYSNVELYDPQSGTWANATSMNELRVYHTAVLLPSGEVLVAAGSDYSWGAASLRMRAELYNPATDTWTYTGSINVGRWGSAAVVLPSGKALLIGGTESPNNNSLPSAELYDPASHTWTMTSPMNEARGGGLKAVVLSSGKVLVVGGNTSTNAELYDPANDTWTITGPTHGQRCGATPTLLTSGKVLVAGGSNCDRPSFASAELYDPSNNTWTPTAAMNLPRFSATSTLLPSGKVLVAGGMYDNGSTWVHYTNAEVYDPANGSWTLTTGSMSGPHANSNAILLPSGKVLTAMDGGSNADLYSPDPGGPNFVVTGITLTPASPAANTAFTAHVTVKNQGTAGDAGKLTVFTDRKAVSPCGVSGKKSATVGALATNESKTVDFADLKVSAAGIKTFRAFVDAKCATAEANENDNQLSVDYRVRRSLPDFVVSSISVNPGQPVVGGTLTATLTVTNQGTKAGDGGYLDVWADQRSVPECGADSD